MILLTTKEMNGAYTMQLRNGILFLALLLAGFTVTAGVLHRAAADGDIDALKSGIQAGENVDGTDRRGMTPLHKAAANGRLKALKVLLKVGADPELMDREGRTALELAKAEGQTAVAAFLENRNHDEDVGDDEDDDDEDCE